jgi:putative flippase GtrA
MISRRFVLFVVAGGTAALANFGSRIGLSLVMPYVPAIVLAYGVGMLTAFVLNRAFVFTDAGTRMHHQVFWFAVVNLLAVAQTLAISLLLARWALPALGVQQHVETIAHAFGVAVPVVTSYLGHKRLTFRAAP